MYDTTSTYLPGEKDSMEAYTQDRAPEKAPFSYFG